MINQSNNVSESQKIKKTCFYAHFQYTVCQKVTGLNKMQSLKSLAMLKCESRTSLYAVQNKRQPGSVLIIYYYFKNGFNLETLCSCILCGSKPGFVLRLFLIFCQNQGVYSYEKECI